MRWFWELGQDERVGVWCVLCVVGAGLAMLWWPLCALMLIVMFALATGSSR